MRAQPNSPPPATVPPSCPSCGRVHPAAPGGRPPSYPPGAAPLMPSCESGRAGGGHAACWGGPWLWRVRPSGAVAVVVPSGWQVIVQRHRWITTRWWNRHSKRRFPRLVGPPLAQGIRWCTSQTEGGWVQPGNWQCWSRWMTAVRRCGGMVRVVRPRSSGWLGVLNGAPSRVPRRWEASPPGPDSRSRLQRRMVACSRRRVASRQPAIPQSWSPAAAGASPGPGPWPVPGNGT